MRSMKLSPLISALTFYAGAILLGVGPAAHGAVTYQFEAITPAGNEVNASLAETQISVDVFDRSGYAVFKFANAAGEPLSITQIYFDDDCDVLADFAGSNPLSSEPGILFTRDATPQNLPEGKSITPKFIADFALGSEPPIPHNGINPGEELQVGFSYVGGKDITSVENAISSDCLRIGVHVQAFERGDSVSLITGNPNVIPEPCSILLTTIGVTVAGALKRRRSI